MNQPSKAAMDAAKRLNSIKGLKWNDRNERHAAQIIDEAMKEERQTLRWILDNCKIVYFPGSGDYPIEHSKIAGKDCRHYFMAAAREAYKKARGEE